MGMRKWCLTQTPPPLWREITPEMMAMIQNLKNNGFEIVQTQPTSQENVKITDGGSKLLSNIISNNNISKPKTIKRKNNELINNSDNKKNVNFILCEDTVIESLVIKNIGNKKRYLNPFLLSKDVKSVLPKSINSSLLAHGDIKVDFKSKHDLMESKYIKIQPVFGEKSELKIYNKNNYKIVIHYLPSYISNEDIKNYLENEGIGVVDVTLKKLKNNEYFNTAFVSFDDKQTQQSLVKKMAQSWI